MKIARVSLPIAIALLGVASASAAPVIWTDWISGTAGSSGSASGVLDIAGEIVNVSYVGEISFIQTGVGTDYFTEPNAANRPYTKTSLVDNRPTAAEMIALSTNTTKTLTFSRPISNLFFAFVSLNGNGYEFNEDFDFVSCGQGFWGTGCAARVDVGGGVYRLNATSGEPHGVIRFNKDVSSISWTSLSNEYWNGFTVGTYGLASTVPEPSTTTLAVISVTIMTFLSRRFRRK